MFPIDLLMQRFHINLTGTWLYMSFIMEEEAICGAL